MDLFPMFLKLAGKPCLVVGAGRIAEAKIESLRRAGARIRVVAPQATLAIRALARREAIVWERRAFLPKDLDGAQLVVAATSSPAVHEVIYREAERSGVPCNVVDDPPRCDFYFPAVVRRGPLQIAISTGGRCPSLAQLLRERLELQFGPEYANWVKQLGRDRQEIFARVTSPARRRRLLRALAQRGPRRGRVRT